MSRAAGIGKRVSTAALATTCLVLLLAACTSKGGEPGQWNSGIKGVVMAGPQCPILEVQSPCPDRPFPGIVRATKSDGAVTKVNTDVHARFRMPLPPGKYVISVDTGTAGMPMSIPQTLRVTEGSFVKVTLQVDTGIR